LIEIRCFGSLDEAAHLRDPINALNLASARPDPFSTFEFFENFLRYNALYPQSQGFCLWFLAAFDAGRLVGYVALKQVTHRVFCRRTAKLDFLVTHDADRPQLVAKPEHVLAVSEALYTYLLERKGEWSFLEFRQQDAASPLFPPPAAGRLKGYWVRKWPSPDNGTIPMHWGTLGEYYGSLSKKSRSNVSRQMRSLFAAGEVEYLASSDAATTQALFELYHSIEPRSWKSRVGEAIGRCPQWCEYFKGLLDAGQPMRISIQVLLLDGVPIAGLISGAFMKGLYALHTVADDRLSRLAPGSAMLLMGVRQAIDGRYAFFNLLSGFGYYKARWQAQMTATHVAQIYRVGGPSFWHRVFGDCKRWAFSAWSKEAPMQFNPLRRGVGELPSLPMSSAERERIAALILEIRKGRGEFLSAGGLAAVMPFETQQVAGVSKARAAPDRRGLPAPSVVGGAIQTPTPGPMSRRTLFRWGSPER
jgi:Acetyltransferase (GNAT) domain